MERCISHIEDVLAKIEDVATMVKFILENIQMNTKLAGHSIGVATLDLGL